MNTTATRTPVWFCDIDGVLAPLNRRQPDVTYEVVPTNGYNGAVLVVVEVIHRVRALAASGLVEVRWLTSWEDEAAEFFAPEVGMPALHVHTSRDSLSDGWWKQGVVDRFLDGSLRHVIWTDDELGTYEAGIPDADQHRSLVIEPQPEVGLTLADLDRIEAWLREDRLVA